MPWNDWQFWTVTAAALWGVWQLLRQFLPLAASEGPASACGGCATGSSACAAASRRPETNPGSELVTLGRR